MLLLFKCGRNFDAMTIHQACKLCLKTNAYRFLTFEIQRTASFKDLGLVYFELIWDFIFVLHFAAFLIWRKFWQKIVFNDVAHFWLKWHIDNGYAKVWVAMIEQDLFRSLRIHNYYNCPNRITLLNNETTQPFWPKSKL